MTVVTYITTAEFVIRAGTHVPRTETGETDTARIEAAIEDAAGVIRSYIPELLDDTGTPLKPPARLVGALRSISLDLALFRIFDAVSGGEDVLAKRNRTALKMLSELGGGVEPHQEADVGPVIIEGASSWIPGEKKRKKETA